MNSRIQRHRPHGVAEIHGAGIGNHDPPVYRKPSRVVRIDYESIDAATRHYQASAPNHYRWKGHRAHLGDVVEVDLPIDADDVWWRDAAFMSHEVAAEKTGLRF